MTEVVWSQWIDLTVPKWFTKLSPADTPLATSDLSSITFYVPEYMGGRSALEYSREMPVLKYLQVPNAGYEDAVEFLSEGMLLCNARGVHDASTSELAIGLAIAVRRGFQDFGRAQALGEWRHKRYESFSDSRVAIVGFGSIGQALARILSGFDVEVESFSRSGSDGAFTMDRFDRNIGEFDIIFLTLPLNGESKHFMNKQRLASMKSGSLLVNVSRGGVIDTDALVSELDSGRIFAGLDVTDPEPLPHTHPLWRSPNCLITPHVGGDSTAFESHGKRFVEDQLARISVGMEPLNIVARA